MSQRRLIKIGDRVINIDALTLASFDPTAGNPATDATWVELTVFFGNEDEAVIFYGAEANQLWALISSPLCCQTITPYLAPSVQELAG